MTIIYVTILIGFMTVIQAFIPRLVKQSIVFGVTVPEQFSHHEKIDSFKRMYTNLTLVIGIVALVGFFLWTQTMAPLDENIILIGTTIVFSIMTASVGLYFIMHAKMLKLKKEYNWNEGLKEVRVVDVQLHKNEEIMPWSAYIVLMVITACLIVYTFTQYGSMPDQIPIHWGIDGKPDSFVAKHPFTAIAVPLILAVVQGMILSINEMLRHSGIQLNVNKKKVSRVQQLAYRKYSSWFLYFITFLCSILLVFLQLSTLHENMTDSLLTPLLPLMFLFFILITTAIYAFKVGQGGSRIHVDESDDPLDPSITNIDDDQYWKGGIFYVNKNDPSFLVEKRFGVGWTLNFGRPMSVLLFVVPIALILLITFLM